MPTYVYETILPDGSGGEVFEVEQTMKDAALRFHPATGQPVRKLITLPNLGLRHSEGATRSRLENKNVEKAGFTKYVRDKSSGDYHRVAGKEGPSVINRKTL